jgi:hypothetical protein
MSAAAVGTTGGKASASSVPMAKGSGGCCGGSCGCH